MSGWTEKLPELPGIYKFTNLINGKIYCGQSYNIKQRVKRGYIWKQTNLRPIIRAIEKYGIGQFKIEAIEVYPPNTKEIILLKRETFWIQFFESHKSSRGYNVTEITFDERGKKYRDRKTEINTLKKEGIWIPCKRKRKIKDASFVKHWTSGKRVHQIDLTTNKIIKTWESATEASIALSGGKSNKVAISRVAQGKYASKSSMGFGWEFADNSNRKVEIPEEIRKSWSLKRCKSNLSEESRYKMGSSIRGKKVSAETIAKRVSKTTGQKRPTICVPILQICPKTQNILRRWESATQAAIELFGNVNKRGHIGMSLRGEAKTALGFIWKREKDYV